MISWQAWTVTPATLSVFHLGHFAWAQMHHRARIRQRYLLLLLVSTNIPITTPLKGAVADANSVSDFLVQHRDVDPSRITNLRDKDATESKIVDSLKSFVDDPLIKQEDTIIIYFAGHTRGSGKGYYNEEDPVAILAVDYSRDDPESCVTADELYELLSAISESKRCNIVRFPSDHTIVKGVHIHTIELRY